MRNLIASLVVVLFVSLNVTEMSAQRMESRLGLGVHRPILDNGVGITVDYDLSWVPNRFTSFGLGATLGGQSVSHSFIAGGSESYVIASLNVVGRLHLPFKNIKFRPTFTFTTGPAINPSGDDYYVSDSDGFGSNLDNRTSIALGHEGTRGGFAVYVASTFSGDVAESGLRFYKRF